MSVATAPDADARRALLPPVLPEAVEVPEGAWLRLTGAIFGTSWRVDVVFAGAEREQPVWLAGLRLRIEAVLEAIDAEMSPWRPDSALMRFNRAGDGAVVPVSAAMRAVVEGALDMARMTGGAFDPTLHDAVTAWGFGAVAVPEGLPDTATLAGRRDWRDLVLTAEGLVARDGLALDLNGIAKGYAVDAVMDLIRADPKAEAALVEIGGELKGWGIRPDGMPWWVEIEQPEGAPGLPLVAALLDGAVATSGDYLRRFTQDGIDYCHTLDPRDLTPVRTGVASVTLFDPLCWRADALATALMVMGRDEALAFAEAHAIPCLLTVREGAALAEYASAALRDWFDDDG